MRDDGNSGEDRELRCGQIWLIELLAGGFLSAHDCGALAQADIILFDRVLAPLVSGVLPAGGYAEPLAPADGDGASAISKRALQLAGDGWRVVQLAEPCRGWRRRLRAAAEGLAHASGNGGPPLRLFARTASDHSPRREADLHELPKLTDGPVADELLTLIVGPLGALRQPAAAFTANGLAG